MSTVTLHHGDALDVLATLPDASADAVITDPPYGLSNTTPTQVADTLGRWAAGERSYVPTGKGFMGKEWDAFVPPPALWEQVMRVLKPGGHVLCFAGSRTQDLMALSMRMAGLDLRDTLMWVYGSGMPKSHNVSKAIDKAAGASRAVVAEGKPVKRMIPGADQNSTGSWIKGNGRTYTPTVTAPATDEAAAWEGWGTSLKPGYEPIIMARKPLQGTVASNVLAHGTGAINIDATRIPHRDPADLAESARKNQHGKFGTESGRNKVYGDYSMIEAKDYDGSSGRWPANVVFDHAAAAELDAQSGTTTSTGGSGAASGKLGYHGGGSGDPGATAGGFGDTGGASRFFYRTEAPALGEDPAPGRWPANVAFDHEAAAELDAQSGTSVSRKGKPRASATPGQGWGMTATGAEYDDAGGASRFFYCTTSPTRQAPAAEGRWPANVAFDEHAAADLDAQSGTTTSQRSTRKAAGTSVGNGTTLNRFQMNEDNVGGYDDAGGASRFFYCAKASTKERPVVDGVQHSTVKPVDLMRWLVRMVCPPGAVVVEPFAGSGTTVEAAILEDVDVIAVEREAEYLPLIHHRITRSTTPAAPPDPTPKTTPAAEPPAPPANDSLF